MRIRDVRTIPLEYPLPQPVFDANYIMATKPALLVEVETDDGLIGLGEAAHFGGPLRSTQAIIEGELREHLVGEDPREIERLWEQMHQRAYKHARGGLLIAAMSGIDIALWDLRGKMSGMPLWRLLGGYRRRVPAYATGGFYAEGKGIRELCDEMRAYGRHGFRAVKMGRALESLDIYWFEEPVCPDDVAGSAEVATKVTIPVAGYETCSYGRVSFRDYITARAIHFVQPDVAWSGGLTEGLKIAHLAQAWNLPLAPHIHGSAVAVAAAAHLLGAVPNASMAEMVFPAHPLMADLVREPLLVDATGHLELSDRPGLGVELDSRVVAKYRVDR